MTLARIKSAPADGHGLTDKIVDPHYHALATEQPTKPIVAIVILDPVENGGRKTAKGKHRVVRYEATHLEPVLDANQANELRWLIQALYEARTSTGTQRPIPGLGNDKENCLDVMERLEAWATGKGMTGADLERLWRDRHGMGPDDDRSYGDQGVPGDYRKASFAQLLAFGYDVEALSLDDPLPSDEREDDDEDDEEALPAETDTDPKCEVCSAVGVRLTDGLCDGCAKNVGVPVAKDEPEEAAS